MLLIINKWRPETIQTGRILKSHMSRENKNQNLIMKLKKIFAGISLFALVITLTSAVPFNGYDKSKIETIKKFNMDAAYEKYDNFSKDGKLSYKELSEVVTTAKGEKLSFKEKVALKLFGKKISNNFMEQKSAGGEGKSQLIALLLAFFLGGLGIHRFYLGYTWQGVVQLLTAGGCGIWALIDFIRIITGDLKPKDGEYGSKL